METILLRNIFLINLARVISEKTTHYKTRKYDKITALLLSESKDRA